MLFNMETIMKQALTALESLGNLMIYLLISHMTSAFLIKISLNKAIK